MINKGIKTAKNLIDNGKLTLEEIADASEISLSKVEELARESKLQHYMSLPYQKIITAAKDGGYVGYISELKGCITQSDTKVGILEMLEDAKDSWLEAALEDGIYIPEPQDVVLNKKGKDYL